MGSLKKKNIKKNTSRGAALPVDRSLRHERVQHGRHQRLPHLRQQPVALLDRVVEKPLGVRVRAHLHELRKHVVGQVGFVHRVPL